VAAGDFGMRFARLIKSTDAERHSPDEAGNSECPTCQVFLRLRSSYSGVHVSDQRRKPLGFARGFFVHTHVGGSEQALAI